MARRTLNWSAELSAFKADRAARPEVRCEPVRSFTRGVELVAWRGRSGRRYICRTVSVDLPFNSYDLLGMVAIAVCEDGQIIGVRADCSLGSLRAMISNGAKKIHLHSLADTAAERSDIARDLRPLAREAA